MEIKIIDRVESNRVEKSKKLFFYLGLASAILLLLKIYFKREKLGVTGFWFDLLVMILPVYLMVKDYINTKGRLGQFIEWQEFLIQYKLKEDNTVQTIPIENIKHTNIGLEKIHLETRDGELILDIEDFTNFEIIKRIKGNFEKLK